MAQEGVPETAQEGVTTLDECLRYGNHRSIKEHSHVTLEKMKQDLRRSKKPIFPRRSAREIGVLRVPPLGAVVSPKKVRVIHGLTFDLSEESRRGGANAQRSVDDFPPCLCAQALPARVQELTRCGTSNQAQ